MLFDLMKRAGKPGEIRNQITHSLWGAGKTLGTVGQINTTVNRKRGIEFNFKEVGEPELKKWRTIRILSRVKSWISRLSCSNQEKRPDKRTILV